jgi:hypothetical protein
MDYKDSWNELKISILEWQNQLKDLENQRLKDRKGVKMANVYYSMDSVLKRVIEKMEKLEE